jgi:hypothetical protein
MQNNYSLLINTCDNFEDCWIPFFKLFTIYWPDYKGRIYLNTEYKDFSYLGLDIVCTKVCEVNKVPRNKRATWSQCLKWALEQIDTDIVLYMQEDYFLNNNVKTERVDYFYNLMDKNIEIPNIQLTNAGIPAIDKANFEYLCISNPNYFSYVSCQAAFWRKQVLISIIREHETAWNFEWWGSKRAKYLDYEFLVVAPTYFKPTENLIMSYVLTGVVGGKWHKDVIELFKKHNLKIDFKKRGFYDENTKPTIKKRVKTKLSIWKLKSIIEIIKMKYL